MLYRVRPLKSVCRRDPRASSSALPGLIGKNGPPMAAMTVEQPAIFASTAFAKSTRDSAEKLCYHKHMSVLKPSDASLLALLAHPVGQGSTVRKKRLVTELKDTQAQEIAKAILGKRTRSTNAKETAIAIRRWAAKATS